MRNIIIYSKDETEAYTLPSVRDVKNGGENVCKEIQMAAGNFVQYIQGYRPGFSATWDYFPADLLADLTGLLRRGGYFKVDYPDLDGADKSGYFKITQSQMGVFRYKDGVPIWHGLTLTFVSREVV